MHSNAENAERRRENAERSGVAGRLIIALVVIDDSLDSVSQDRFMKVDQQSDFQIHQPQM